MENLLKPDTGLMIWTIVTFLSMVFLLKKVAWGPILKTIDEREAKMREEMENAQKNRLEMEKLKLDYENQLQQIEVRAKNLLDDAENKARSARENILKEAEVEAKNLSERTRKQLEDEKNRLVLELRQEVSQISIQATEKLLQQSVDSKTHEKFIHDFVDQLHTSPKK